MSSGTKSTAIASLAKSIVPQFFRTRLHWSRLLTDCPNFNRSRLEATFETICSRVDIGQIRDLYLQYSHAIDDDPACAAKYLDHQYWLRVNIVRAARLKLHDSAPKRILDLGCGPGWFLHVCRHFGHDAMGLDVPVESMTEIEKKVYASMAEVLCWHKKELRIQPASPFNIKGTFDHITGFMVCFNNHRQESEWSKEEWKTFVERVLTQLNAGGSLWLELNPNPPRYPRLIYYDPDTHEYFNSIGRVSRNVIHILKDSQQASYPPDRKNRTSTSRRPYPSKSDFPRH